jgi:hypothetical protein
MLHSKCNVVYEYISNHPEMQIETTIDRNRENPCPKNALLGLS